MKMLDEVIATMEYEAQYNNGEQREFDADALHYLREYRRTQTAYIKAMADIVDNPPLTFDEVREMVGMPVWMEWNDVKGWRLVNCFDSTITGEKAVALTDRFGVDFVFSAETFAKCEVKVYRKERK